MKKAIVIGATSGIGRETAVRLVEEGWEVGVSGRRIEAARCTLPITSRQDIPASYGMRHKAAIGITEETDADVIVVSEETGGISFGRNGNLQDISNINELKLLLGASLSGND